jgi:hypothetical protein
MSAKGRIVRPLACWAVALGGVLAGGCLVPYAYPHLSHISGLTSTSAPGEVHAFRVEVQSSRVDLGQTTERYTLARVPLEPNGRVPAQTSLSLDYGAYVVGVALNYPIHHGRSLLVRLYRPGFQLVEVQSGQSLDQVRWQPASDLTAQERALDALLVDPAVDLKAWTAAQITPGSAAPEHREALLFAAAEYERLADGLADPETRRRLLHKALEVRERLAQ